MVRGCGMRGGMGMEIGRVLQMSAPGTDERCWEGEGCREVCATVRQQQLDLCPTGCVFPRLPPTGARIQAGVGGWMAYDCFFVDWGLQLAARA